MARTLVLDTITEPSNSGAANITLSSDTTTTLPKVDINGGAIDSTTLGAATPSSVAATTLSASGNATLSGTGNSVGTITTGTWSGTEVAVAKGGTGATAAAAARTNLGISNANYTDDGWKYLTSSWIDLSASGSSPDYMHTIDFDRQQYKGDNVTESAGVYTLTTAGIYAISCVISEEGSTSGDAKAGLFHYDTSATTTIWYEPTLFIDKGSGYGPQGSFTWFVNIGAGDTVYMKGKGYFAGNWCGSGSISCLFHGCRIG